MRRLADVSAVLFGEVEQNAIRTLLFGGHEPLFDRQLDLMKGLARFDAVPRVVVKKNSSAT